MKFGFNFDGGFFDFNVFFFNFSQLFARFLGVSLASNNSNNFRIGVLFRELDLAVCFVTDAADIDAVFTNDVAMVRLY